jgi:hypothetical protein
MASVNLESGCAASGGATVCSGSGFVGWASLADDLSSDLLWASCAISEASDSGIVGVCIVGIWNWVGLGCSALMRRSNLSLVGEWPLRSSVNEFHVYWMDRRGTGGTHDSHGSAFRTVGFEQFGSVCSSCERATGFGNEGQVSWDFGFWILDFRFAIWGQGWPRRVPAAESFLASCFPDAPNANEFQ